MPVITDKEYRKPKFQRGNRVMVVDRNSEGGVHRARISNVDAVTGRGIRVRGEDKDFHDNGEGDSSKRVLLLPDYIAQSFQRSSLMRGEKVLENIALTHDMLVAIDAYNEQNA